MPSIKIISSSVRDGRKSDRVALYLKNYLKENKQIDAEILDLKVLDFPMFSERLKNIKDPLPEMVSFSEKIKNSDGIFIVTPEYNGGYPASLKNVVDLLYDEWKRKPVAITTVSSGAFGGSQVITSLLFVLWKIGSWVSPAMFPIANVEKSFNEEGIPVDKEATDKRAAKFVDELLWCVTASSKMK